MSAVETAVKIAPETSALFEQIEMMRDHYGLSPTPEGQIPVPPTFEEMRAGQDRNVDITIDEIVREHGGRNSAEDWRPYWYGGRSMHKRNMPRFMVLTSLAECWTPEAEADMVHSMWTVIEWPGQDAPHHWRRLFERAGFHCDEHEDGGECDLHPDGQPGTEPVEVFRGSFASHKRNLSWTTSRERAEWFAGRGDMAGKGRKMRVYRTVVPADRIYAHHTGRGEDEIVADVRGLKIEVVS